MARDREPNADGRNDGPTGSDLAAIEAEWPLIEAELAVLDAEIHMLTVRGGPTALDWRRLRRAEDRVTREAAALAASRQSRRVHRRAA
jgi:hypothetical protein